MWPQVQYLALPEKNKQIIKVNSDCPPDRIKRCSRHSPDTPVSVRMFPGRVSLREEDLPPECGQHHLMRCGPRLTNKNRGHSAKPHHSPFSASCSKMQRGEKPGPLRLPLKTLPRCLVRAMRKGTDAHMCVHAYVCMHVWGTEDV